MLIARIIDGNIEIADHRQFIPQTSFGAAGPTLAQIEEIGFMQVTVWKPHNELQKLVACPPYVEDGQVFTVTVGNKTQDELNTEAATQAAQMRIAKQAAYRDESDPLFFKAQRGEATMEEWLAKVEEIKARFVDPVPLVAIAEETVIITSDTIEMTGVDSVIGG